MSNKTKALLYNLVCFAVIFVVVRLLLGAYSGLEGYWLPITTFVVSTIISPKFQAVTTRDGDKIFMRWMFVKGLKKF